MGAFGAALGVGAVGEDLLDAVEGFVGEAQVGGGDVFFDALGLRLPGIGTM